VQNLRFGATLSLLLSGFLLFSVATAADSQNRCARPLPVDLLGTMITLDSYDKYLVAHGSEPKQRVIFGEHGEAGRVAGL
jgi:hypothetical protein